MSILDSAEEATAAQERLRAATDESLLNDLRFWTLASYDAAEDYRQIHQRINRTRVLHAEAEQWVGLIAQELRSRRPGATGFATTQEENES